MKRIEVSKITCVADVRLTERLEAEADRMGILEIHMERSKQVSLRPRPFWMPLGHRTVMVESPSDILHFYVPRTCEHAAMARLAAAAELLLPGRGSVFAEQTLLIGEDLRLWDDSRLGSEEPAWFAENRMTPPAYDLIFCIVQRGRGEELARTLLEMGLGVPFISYGEGMGMRDRLGLLRITIPAEKEILWVLALPGDSSFVMDVATRKAALEQPGRGFLGRAPVRALAVNSRMYQTRRKHVASMEQVISTLDQLRGSTDWRRMSTSRRALSRPHPQAPAMVRLSLICEEGATAEPLRAAFAAGAGGATLSRLTRRMPEHHDDETEGTMVSHARECCDLVIPRARAETIETAVRASGFFEPSIGGVIEIAPVHDTITYRGG